MTKIIYKTHEFRRASRGLLEKVAEICETLLRKDASIVDLGCGKGGLLRLLKEKGFSNLTGADMDVNQFKFDDIKILKINLNKHKIIDGTYDAVIATEVIEHVENPTKLFDDCFNILKRGGHLIISTPNNQNWFGRLFFLLTGTFPYFSVRNDRPAHPDHRTPIFDWQFYFFSKGRFRLIERHYNRIASPVIHFQIPTRKHILGDNVIYVFKRL